MTSRFWTICTIPLLPMGAAAVVFLMTLPAQFPTANSEQSVVVVLASTPPHVSNITHARDRSFSDARARPSVGTGHSLQSELR
jgi:hypothetical protein